MRNKFKITIILIISYILITLTACSSDSVLPELPSAPEDNIVINDEIFELDKDLISDEVDAEDAEQYFISQGFAPFLETEENIKKSLDENENIVYLYLDSNDIIEKIKYIIPINDNNYKNNLLSGEINTIADIIFNITKQELNQTQRKEIKNIFSKIISNEDYENSIQYDFNNYIINFSVEPLNQYFMFEIELNPEKFI